MKIPIAALIVAVAASSSCLAVAGASAQSVTDAQIASIVVTANQVDIDAGKLAKSRASHADVKAFADRMVVDHAGVIKSATELVTRLKVVPQDNATSQSLKAGGDKNLADLKSLKGAAFDKAYVDHEVAYHEQVLDAVDKTLIPGAKNDELKALLVKVRPAFVAHLEHAKKIQAQLDKGQAAARPSATIDGTQFQPDTLTARVGVPVVWVNKDPFPHTVTSSSGPFDSGQIAAGASWTYTPRKTGVYAYVCTLHPTMKATLRVE
jgi:putative membrane protein